MKRYGYLLAATCLAAIAGSIAASAAAAEAAVLAQDLGTAKASGKVLAVLWTRRPDSYTLQVVLDRSRYQISATPTPLPQIEKAAVTVPDSTSNLDRSSYFIGSTITSLRCLDPAFGTRSLPMVDGRRLAGERPAALASKRPEVQVWLLRADGTQILPTAGSLQRLSAAGPCPSYAGGEEMLYRFPVAESAQAVAVAIQIDDQYYIEKLQPLAQ